ncbi:YMGG-like glycine zipper-containing protein [Uliginosibacterium sp. H3]|uniref:YMGG-like glycine zipper-containing protein n=1 Tax=Uliginosibacterium silvisoli TaxID=3114758 RepID=A0ABU6K7T5_9RHOO|nr:YMGG-like glycine zipper-containing protein [Uliginosibacterium sp. H3]
MTKVSFAVSLSAAVVMMGVLGAAQAQTATVQKPVIYPAKGQSAAQQSTDDGECYAWAKKDTGIDPAVVATAAPAQPAPEHGGQRARGAVRGAAAGAVVGEIANDDAGHGAAVGAAAGVVAGGARKRQERRAGAAQAQQSQAQQQQAMTTYYRAYGACMQGRGYSLK